ncbi:MAG: DUF2889 domain-containing protein [Syntrophomonadaceae bacterium]|nr:DUF2889 domain-containing protein [Syntrophomonadaceae bacterium]
MKCVFNASHFTTVIRKDNELLAQSVYLSTSIEAIGMVRADVSSFMINGAEWEIYRSPDNLLNELADVPELKGTEAFLNVGQALRDVIGDRGGGLPRELLAECIRGLIQAETFVYQERGYSSPEAYDNYWEELSADYCRYFTNLDKVEKHWRDHVGPFERGRSLYNRCKKSEVWVGQDGRISSGGSFIDSYHELCVQIRIDSRGVIEECQGNFLRAPDRICFENADNLNIMIGQNLADLSKRQIGGDLGGPQGCFHLVDLVYDIGQAVNEVFQGMRRG